MSLTVIFGRNVGSIPHLFGSVTKGQTIVVVDGRKFRGFSSAVDLDRACQDFPGAMRERLEREPDAIIFCARHFDEARDMPVLTGGGRKVSSDLTKTGIKNDVTDVGTQNPCSGVKEYVWDDKGEVAKFAVFRSPEHILVK